MNYDVKDFEGWGVAVMVGVGCLGGSRPAPPWALTLALSRRAGEGTVVVLFGLCGEGELLDTDFRRRWGAGEGCASGLVIPR